MKSDPMSLVLAVDDGMWCPGQCVVQGRTAADPSLGEGANGLYYYKRYSRVLLVNSEHTLYIYGVYTKLMVSIPNTGGWTDDKGA